MIAVQSCVVSRYEDGQIDILDLDCVDTCRCVKKQLKLHPLLDREPMKVFHEWGDMFTTLNCKDDFSSLVLETLQPGKIF